MTTPDNDLRAEEHRHPAAHRFDPVDHRGRQRSSHDLHVGGRDRRDAVLRPRCATTRSDPQNPDNDRFVLSKGHAAPILYAAWARGGPLSARGAAEAPRGSTRTSRAIRRRGCRSSTSRPDRSARASAPASASRSTRAASGPTTAPTCCSATARWPKARCGKRRTWPLYHKLDNLCGIIDVNALGQSRPHAVRSRHGRDRRALERVRLAHDHRRRPRRGGAPRRVRRGARDARASRR